MTKRKPMLILLATGTAGGKETFISKIKKNQLLSDNKIYQIGTDEYVTVRMKEESRTGEIAIPHQGAGLDNRQKKEYDENLQVQIKIEQEWFRPESVNSQALKKKINDELSEQDPNKIIIVEGAHALQFDDIRELADLKIWIQNDDDLRLIRKITRSPYYKKMVGEVPEDPRNFGGTLTPFPNAFKCWVDGNKPTEKSYVFPTKKHADLIIFSNDWAEFYKGVNKVVSIINLYFKGKEEFKNQLVREKKQRIEGEIIALREQLQAKETELSQLVTEQTNSYQQQTK